LFAADDVGSVPAMKICLLLMLISVIVGVSYFPNRRQPQATPEPLPARV
jgi:hypothetical protein